MLDTLIQIGTLASVGQNEWDALIFKPQTDVKTDQTAAKTYQYLIYFLEFDLDAQTMRPEVKATYNEERANLYRNLQVKGGNNSAYYTTVHTPKHFEQLSKTLFGKKPKLGDKIPTKGEFLDLIEKENPALRETILAKALEKIFELKELFQTTFAEGDKSAALKVSATEKMHLLVAAVKWAAEGIEEMTPLCQLDGYEAFILNKLLPKVANPNLKLCYASGKMMEDVAPIQISNRYSLNKMFVETTKNYASDFDKNKFGNNYQASLQQQAFLEAGSNKVLTTMKLSIAGIDHCILPHFSQHAADKKHADRNILIKGIKQNADLMFGFQKLDTWIEGINTQKQPLYWLTFMGFESDGNFFKTINLIKDVNAQHFIHLIEKFSETSTLFRQLDGAQWEAIMVFGKERKPYAFNFHTLYTMIPVRKDKEKKNVALLLFKSILEQRPIAQSLVFQYFKELILCHRFERYAAYPNIYANDNFDFAVRNAAFQYLALIHILKQFNLLKDMANQEIAASAASPKDYPEKILAFFEKMGYNEDQKALFYLGRVLNSVAYAQVLAKHKNKPILNKLNYNGMDLASLAKLVIELSEKTQQYTLHASNEWLMSRFTDVFKPNGWDIRVSKDEALLYLLLGYSFRTANEKAAETNSDTTNS